MVNHKKIANMCVIMPYKADFEEDYLQMVQLIEREILKARQDGLGKVEDHIEQIMKQVDRGWIDLVELKDHLTSIKQICQDQLENAPDAD